MLYIYCENVTFIDLATEVQQCFLRYGIAAELTTQVNSNNFLDLYIIFGMNDFNSLVVPHNYIVYQLEQTTGNNESNWFNTTYLNYLKKSLGVWDYSLVNYQNLRKQQVGNIICIPLLYMPSIDTITQQLWTAKDIDVLFIGSFNERRQVIIDQLRAKGLQVEARNNVWKEERGGLITRSKIIINIHYFQHSILETVRLSYLLSNGCFVVSETSADPLLDRAHKSFLRLAPYDQLVSACEDLLVNDSQREQLAQQLQIYKQTAYGNKLPIQPICETYGHLVGKPLATVQESASAANLGSSQSLQLSSQIINSSDLFEAETEITTDQQLILKLPKLTPDELPFVSIVTPTYNRRNIFKMAIRNWELFEYPREKLEWIIVDDSDNGQTLSSLLPQSGPESSQIKYYKLQTTGRLSIGQKRNFGVEKASHEYIVFMDDDDYYYPLSVYARVALLIKYPQYDLVGVTKLDIYDVANDFCARINGPHVSEASMAFRKILWQQRRFQDQFNTLGEGYPFLKDRRDRVIKMPSCFNLIAFTHWDNYTQRNRSQDKFRHVGKKDNLLRTLDLNTRLFIFNLFDTVKKGLPRAVSATTTDADASGSTKD